MSPLSALAVCLVALVALHPATALRCWECDSLQDPLCDDPFRANNRFAILECQPSQFRSYPVCMKVKSRLPDGRAHVKRSCQFVDPSDNGRNVCSPLSQVAPNYGSNYPNQPYGNNYANQPYGNNYPNQPYGSNSYGSNYNNQHQEYCSICNSDACNSAPRPAVPLVAILAAPLAALAFWMRL